MLFCISVAVGLVMAVLLFRLFFSDFPDFVEGFCRPNFCTLKVIIWAVLSVAMGFSAYHTLPRHFSRLARHGDSKAATNATSNATAVQARIPSAPATNSFTAPPSTAATVNGVRLGDTVQVSAIHPPVALRGAVITSIDDTQLTVRVPSGSYTILWKDLTDLKPATVSTNKAGPK